jgi:hypothetical protein
MRTVTAGYKSASTVILGGRILVTILGSVAILGSLLCIVIRMAPADPCSPNSADCGIDPWLSFGVGAVAFMASIAALTICWRTHRQIWGTVVAALPVFASLAAEYWVLTPE